MERRVGHRLSQKRSMKALVLAVGLRMQRSAVTDLDAQSYEPDSKRSDVLAATASPRSAVVGVDSIWHSISLKSLLQPGLHEETGLARQSFERHVEARMVVDHSQWIAAPGPVAEHDPAFEVHLPERVRPLVLEAMPWSRRCTGLGSDQAVAMQ